MAIHQINNILGGISKTLHIGQEGSYAGACGIDPEKKISGRLGGAISPTGIQKAIDNVKDILWIEPNDVNDDIYFYTADGKFGKIKDVNSDTFLLFDEENETYVSVPCKAELNPAGTFTTSVRVKLSKEATASNTVLSFWLDGLGFNYPRGYKISTTTNNKWQVRVAVYNEVVEQNISKTITSDNEIVVDTEYLLTLVIDDEGDFGSIKFYINDSLIGTEPITNASGYKNNHAEPLIMGATSSPQYFLNGVIYDARIYNRVLSATEIADLYNKETVDDTNLISWWKFDEEGGTVIADSKSDNDGTITNENWINEQEIISTLSNASGNGLVYYNNYYYIAVDSNIHRYGPIDGTPTLEENWWTGLSEEDDFIISAQGDTKVIDETTTKVAQIISNPMDFNKISIAIKNTGTTNPNINISIQGVDESEVSTGNGTTFTALKYTKKVPDGEEIASASYEGTIGSELEVIEFEFDETIRPDDDIAIVIDTETMDSDTSFEVMISEFGDAYTSGNLAYYDGDWKITPGLQWDNDATEDTGYNINIKEYTIDTKDDGDLTKPFYLNFRVNPASDSDAWFLAIRKNGSAITSENVSWTIYNDTTSMTKIKDGTGPNIDDEDSGSPTAIVHISATISTDEELTNGDVVGIYAISVDAGDDPVDTGIRYFGKLSSQRKPLFHYEDPTVEEDIGLQMSAITISFSELDNTQYPLIGGYRMPNHAMHVHANNSLYFSNIKELNKIRTADTLLLKDYSEMFVSGDLIKGKSSNATASILRKPQTIFSTEGSFIKIALTGIRGEFEDEEEVFVVDYPDRTATVDGTLKKGEGNVDSDSSVLALADSNSIVAIESINTDIALLTIKSNGTTKQGNASLFLWDTFDTSFYRQVRLPYPLATALYSHNGIPYIWGGDTEGYSLGYYSGSRIENLFYIDNGLPPLQGSVDAQNNRIIWGSSQTYPEARGCVWAYRLKTGDAGLHNIIALDENQVSSLKIYDLKSNPLISNSEGLWFNGDTYDSIFKSETLDFGQDFNIQEVKIGLSRDLTVGEEVVVKFIYDNGSSEDEWTVDKDTYPTRIMKFNPKQKGVQNMQIQIELSSDVSILLPIKVEYELL